MTCRRILFLSVFIFTFGTACLYAETEPTSLRLPRNMHALRNIRVVLMQGKKEAELRLAEPFIVETIQTGEILGQGEAGPLEIAPIRSGLRLGSDEYKIYGVKLVSPSGRIFLGEKSYLDQLQVVRESNETLTLINEIDIEVYLRGVLPKEVLAKWPVEALKAQAVAARTYALFEELYGFDSDFSLTSTVQSQVYGGEDAAEPATNEAIRLTTGEIVLYDGKLLRTYFHSNCGGRTYRADYVWDVEPNSALMGVVCPFGRDVPSFRWRASFSANEISQKLRTAGFALDNVLDLRPEELDGIGRARNIWVRHGGGATVMNANDFRLAVGAGKFKSTMFEVTHYADTFEFKGRGFGHGVGLCQWGMKEMAEEGKTYREILEFYYPGSEVKKIF